MPTRYAQQVIHTQSDQIIILTINNNNNNNSGFFVRFIVRGPYRGRPPDSGIGPSPPRQGNNNQSQEGKVSQEWCRKPGPLTVEAVRKKEW